MRGKYWRENFESFGQSFLVELRFFYKILIPIQCEILLSLRNLPIICEGKCLINMSTKYCELEQIFCSFLKCILYFLSYKRRALREEKIGNNFSVFSLQKCLAVVEIKL